MGGPGSGGWRYSGQRIKRVEMPCAKCGTIFSRLPSRVKRMQGKPGYCSRACQDASLRKEQPKRYPHTCAMCGISFLAKGKKRTYCSEACRNKAVSVELSMRGVKQRTRTCTLCGKPFIRKASNKNKGLVCSRDCYYGHLQALSHVRLMAKARAKAARKHQRASRLAQLTKRCEACGTTFTHSLSSRRFCSWACRTGQRFRRKRIERQCVDCGATFTAGMPGRVGASIRCPAHQKKVAKRKARQRDKQKWGSRRHHVDRARRNGLPRDYSIRPIKLFNRDGWRCRLCGRHTPKHLNGKQQPRSPTIDHIIPIAHGGGHTWDNVQLACHECNMKKGAKTLGQLRLAI